MFETVVVAVDGSDHSDAAVRIAADIAAKYQARLHLVHVPEVEFTAIAVGSAAVAIPVNQEETAAKAKAVIDAAKALATKAGQSASTAEILEGDPAEAILNRAAELNADLLVTGRRGLGKLRGLLMGSVSQKLTTHATCAVLTVK